MLEMLQSGFFRAVNNDDHGKAGNCIDTGQWSIYHIFLFQILTLSHLYLIDPPNLL